LLAHQQRIMAFKIYTKTGDEGTTGLYGGARIEKHHLRIESYGTVDELNTHVGLLCDQISNKSFREELRYIQDRLFVVGSNLAKDPNKDLKVPEITASDVTRLEDQIDSMEADLDPLKTFILPGGHPIVSQAHVVRCVTRRAERRVVALADTEKVPPILIKYLNRLSDYAFVLARALAKELKVDEIPWVSK